MGDENLEDSMKCLEIALQNGAFDEYFYQKMNEFHHENVMKEKREKRIKLAEEKREKQGREEVELEIALKLKSMGISHGLIAEVTGITFID